MDGLLAGVRAWVGRMMWAFGAPPRPVPPSRPPKPRKRTMTSVSVTAGTGRDRKTEFPPSWGDDRIMAAVADTLRNPDRSRLVGDRRVLQKLVDGVLIEAAYYPQQGVPVLRAAFPISGDGVIRNDGGQRIAVPLDLTRLSR